MEHEQQQQQQISSSSEGGEPVATDCGCPRTSVTKKKHAISLQEEEAEESESSVLQDELNDILEAFYSCVSDDDILQYQYFVEKLTSSKLAEGALQHPTDREAPNFELYDQDNERVHLYEILETKGPVILFFYRGKWCPHCNATILRYQKYLVPKLRQINASSATNTHISLIGISPMLPDGTQYLASKRLLEFSICSDVGNTVAQKYNLTFEIVPELRNTFLKWGEDIPKHNSLDSDKHPSWEVPLPATYIINTDRRIVWSHIDNDPGIRADPKDILHIIDTQLFNTAPTTTDTTTGPTTSTTKRKGTSFTFKTTRRSFKNVFGKRRQSAPEFLNNYFIPDPSEQF